MAFEERRMRRRTNFDLYLEKQLRDPGFAERFRKAGEAWDVVLQLTSLHEKPMNKSDRNA